jgi:hypothetical protein
VSSTQALPILSAAIVLCFAFLVFRRFAARRGKHLLTWGIGLTFFGVASAAEAYSAAAWSPFVFRLWYLAGAVLSAAWIGQGTVYLLSGSRGPGGTTGRPRPRRVAASLTWLLLAGSLGAAYLVFTLPLNPSGFDPHRPLSAQYRAILPAGAAVRRLTPVFNIYGTITVVGGALYSAWLLWRGEIAPYRVAGNVLIAAGALIIASASAMVRLGLGDLLYLAEVLAAGVMFSGFLLTTARPAASGGREVARA